MILLSGMEKSSRILRPQFCAQIQIFAQMKVRNQNSQSLNLKSLRKLQKKNFKYKIAQKTKRT